MSVSRIGWSSYFIYGIFVLIFSWTLSGCRFGNRVEYPPQADPYSGYYVTQPHSLTFYVTTSSTLTRTAPVSAVPAEVSDVMTNPVALIVKNPDTGKAILASPVTQYSLPIYLGKDLSLSLSGSTAADTFWQDTQCKSYLEIQEDGQLIQTQNFVPPPGNTHRISGKIKLRVQIITRFRGNCAPSFQSIADCYQDMSQCGGRNSSENQDLQTQIITTFEPMIAAGALTVETIPEIVNYAYEVSYE